jgi:hypothetical protein
MKYYSRQNEIVCPHCDKEMDNSEDPIAVTPWGEDEFVETECGWCLKPFFIKEFVQRTWSTFNTKACASKHRLD